MRLIGFHRISMTRFAPRPARIAALLESPVAKNCVFGSVVALLLAHCWWLLVQVATDSAAADHAMLGDRIALCAVAVVLLIVGIVRRHGETVRQRDAAIIGALCGSMYFLAWIGLELLDPTNIQWLLHNDWAQHYSAWAMYRTAPWTWPPGRIQTLWYPVGTAIVHTDALPLFAFAFKPFSDLLPATFQYIGFWLFTSCVLQGLFAALLIRRFRPNTVAILCGSMLFVLAPIFLGRFFHDTLTAQWLLLAGLWLYFRADPPPALFREAWPWWLLASVAALVHPYLSAMFLAIAFAYWVRRAKVDHERTARQVIVAVTVAVVLTLIAWWLSGAFIIRFSDGGGHLAYGKHSFNLLGFLIPQGFSRIVPNIPLAGPEQWEGQAYLGLGVIILIILLASQMAIRRAWPRLPWRHWPLFAVALALLVFAASTTLTFGPWKLTDVQIQSPLLATFRASGRFIWVPYYLILLATIVAVLSRFPRAGVFLLAFAAITGNREFSLMHLHFARLRTGVGWSAPENLLADPRWKTIASGRHHLTMFPPLACDKQAGPYLPFQLFAAKHGMTFNSGYLARWNLRATQAYCTQLLRDSDAHRFSTDDVYIVDPSWAAKMEADPALHCRPIDGYRVCVFENSNSKPR
jgi:hypothetical protein